MDQRATRLKATAIGFTAVLMWAALALFTALTGKVPPFQLLAMCFGIATLIACVFWLVRGQNPLSYMRQKPMVWLLGVGGLFGYHFFYFVAIDNAPTVEASLIAYLWPLLIVVFSALLPGERLRWFHVAGALLGVICHLAFEQTVWPDSALEWGAVALLGLGPVGGAFFTWDYGVKRGDIQALGASSYAAPLLSTILLILVGLSPFTGVVALACLLIVGGAVLASKDMIFRRRAP